MAGRRASPSTARVQHYTASNSFGSAFDTFARNRPDPELGELPGVCAHDVIDRRGRIYDLVPTTLMCRHTVGLTYTAIGIEHVGTSDGQVLANRRQITASLRLTRHLQGRYAIRAGDVIGHNESLSSAFHRERVARLRRQTHGDFRRLHAPLPPSPRAPAGACERYGRRRERQQGVD
ncbi:MAG: N-acetylmuramoyl-L-alanine amidase [Actinomycetota bacterium]|nr:N-acetylmuramoyl-L-alanine amidase [Actinomycetota bacterium]